MNCFARGIELLGGADMEVDGKLAAATRPPRPSRENLFVCLLPSPYRLIASLFNAAAGKS